MVWQQKPKSTLAEQETKSDSCKRLSQRPSFNTSQRGRETALPGRHRSSEQKWRTLHEVATSLTPLSGTPCADGSRSDASTHQREMWRRENSQTWATEQYICFSAHVLLRQPWGLSATITTPSVPRKNVATGCLPRQPSEPHRSASFQNRGGPVQHEDRKRTGDHRHLSCRR